MSYPVVAIEQPDRAVVYVSVRGPIEVGRECDGVLLGDAQVSRRHLLLDVVDAMAVVTDLGSTNGTELDGAIIAAPVVLMPNSVVLLGNTTIRLMEDDELSDGPHDVSTASDEVVMGAPPAVHEFSGEETSVSVVAAAVVDSGLDLRRLNTDQGTITIVFSGIEAAAERIAALGDQDWLQVLSVHNRIVRQQLAQFGGSEIQNQDDAFMLSFPSARMALACMIEVQQKLAEQAEVDEDRAVRIRAGLHTGEVLLDDGGSLFGEHVALASRIAEAAGGGEILTSALVREITAARGDVVFRDARQVSLPGVDGNQLLYPVDWSQSLAI